MTNKFKHPFTTPDAYFEKLEGRIMENTPGSLLNKLDKKNVYSVPDQFFEQQYLDILAKKESKPSIIFAPKRSLAWVTVAVSSIALVVFSYSYFGSETINDVLSKEGQIIQSDISDLPPMADSLKQDSAAKATTH
jgi:hypothetical protein